MAPADLSRRQRKKVRIDRKSRMEALVFCMNRRMAVGPSLSRYETGPSAHSRRSGQHFNTNAADQHFPALSGPPGSEALSAPRSGRQRQCDTR
jgi:hypothetical protein